ncbi:sigma-70 family RNA polymerase sigma factor [Planctomyces sp. SH-PL62]|uniref:sigma-70 family RNA polymerase sigma factor n=1 Tax=Planctomyces sp. SH-PL62 TaxID=1636152 RepID=UPI00078CDD14|nr:sigma-70 family RNA polymerase sigma factor [Planctomyces sp. SH-PL62]AMV39394.1 ECF RNA polymerase sigma factor SigW [Planctomyces sp. SH-PL62]
MNATTEREADDARLWDRVRGGSREAFEQVVRRHQSLVAAVAYNVCGDLTTSEDVAQETFWAAWKGRDSLQDPNRLRPWLCGIARNLAANAVRRSASRGTSSVHDHATDLEGAGPDPAEAALRGDEQALIWRTLGEIPPLYREPLILYYRQEQSVADVAASLELTEDAVKQRLSRGRAMLRERLASLVEAGLRRSRPGRSFTTGVMAGLTLAGAGSKSAVAATGATLPAVAGSIATGGVFGMLAGLLGGWLGAWLPAQTAATIRQREAHRRAGRRLLLASVGFALVILVLSRTLAGTRAYLPAWLAAMAIFQVWVGIEVWRLCRRLGEIRASSAPDEVNVTAVRQGLAFAARGARGRVYRSRFRFLGLPLVDIQVADPPQYDGDGVQAAPAASRRVATGWIAVGDEARGVLLAVGTRAFGALAIGGAAFGLVSFGGLAIGVVALGGVAVGGLAVAGLAFGVVAVGGLAVGDCALGGASLARSLAVGGIALAWDTAMGGAAIAGQRAVAHEVGARWLAGGPSGVPALEGPIALAARRLMPQGRSVFFGIGVIGLALEFTRMALMYRRPLFSQSTKVGILLAGSLAVFSGCSTSGAPPAPTRFQLDNGLTVLLRPVSGASQTALVVLYDIGGDHDPEGRSGLAHFVEHLYTTAGAGTSAPRTAEEFLQRYPAGCNAQTGDRYTAYATVFPAAQIDAELGEASARMGSLKITEADLDRERPRLIDETARMFELVPSLAAINNAREIVRPTPRGGRRGGLPESLAKITAEEASEYWRRYYKPRNATLVVAGSFDVDDASALIRRHFDGLPAGEERPAPGEPGAIATPRDKVVSVPAPGGSMAAVAIAAPQPRDGDYAGYVVLGARLVKLAMDPSSGIQPYMPLLDDPGAIIVSTVALPTETGDAAAQRLTGRLSQVVQAESTSAEIAEVLSTYGFFLGTTDLPDQALAANLYGVAFAMGRREQLGIEPAAMTAAMQAVTPESVRKAAAGLFAESNRGLVQIRTADSPR